MVYFTQRRDYSSFYSVFVCLIRPIFTHRHGTIVDESVEFRNETGGRSGLDRGLAIFAIIYPLEQ